MASQRSFERSEDEVWLRCLFRHHVGGVQRGQFAEGSSPEIDPRLSGVFEAFRAHPAFAALLELPSAEEFGRGCASFLENQPLATLAPSTHHMLAIYFAEVARVVWSEAPAYSEAPANTAARYLTRSLAHWLCLHLEKTYLREWVTQSLGSEADAPAIALAFMERVMSKLAAIVRASPKAEVTSARVVMQVLSPRHREDIWMLAGAPRESASPFRRAMEGAYEGVAHELMDAFVADVEASKAQGRDPSDRAARIVALGTRLSALTAHLPDAETLVLEHAEPIGWDLRRAKQWKALAHLYGMLSDLVLRLAARVEGDSEQFAYAARAAQALTFLSDAREDLPVRIELTERALRICPGHPMAATMLSFYLASRGLQLLREAGAQKPETRAEVRVLYERAKTLDPKDEAVKKLGALLSALGT